MTYINAGDDEAGDDETWSLRQHRLRAVLGTCRVGVHQLDGYRPKRHWPGPEDCCSEPGSDPLSHFAYLQAKGYQEHRKEGSVLLPEREQGNIE